MWPRGALALALWATATLPARGAMFEGSLDCQKPRLALLRGLCADPQLLALARDTQASFDKALVRLRTRSDLSAALVAINIDLVTNLHASFDQDRFEAVNALRRHKAILDAVQPAPGKGPEGAWAGSGVDLSLVPGRKDSLRMRSQGFGQNAYDCAWQTGIRPVRGGWQTGKAPPNDDAEAFHLRLKRQGDSLVADMPRQSERAPDACPPWASFAGLFVPVAAGARIEHLPSSIITREAGQPPPPATLAEFLKRLPGAPFPEHAPDLTRDLLMALITGTSVEGWTIAHPKPETIVVGRAGGADSIAFQFADKEMQTVEMIALHKERWHLAEWSLRADRRTLFFSVPSLRRSVSRLFLTDRGGLRNGSPRDGLASSDITEDLRQHIDRLSSCQYFGATRQAGPSLPQSEIDRNRASSRCAEIPALEAEIRERRAKFPDALRMLDLAKQLAEE